MFFIQIFNRNFLWKCSIIPETDYIFVKCYEASLVGEVVEEYDFETLHTERQALREQINQLEMELAGIENINVEG